jgi:hypothetical protein
VNGAEATLMVQTDGHVASRTQSNHTADLVQSVKQIAPEIYKPSVNETDKPICLKWKTQINENTTSHLDNKNGLGEGTDNCKLQQR